MANDPKENIKIADNWKPNSMDKTSTPFESRESHMDENQLQWAEQAFNIAKMANDPKENGKIAHNWKPSSMEKSEDPAKSQRDNQGAPVNIIPVPVVIRKTHMDNDMICQEFSSIFDYFVFSNIC